MKVYEYSHIKVIALYPRISEFDRDPGWLRNSLYIILPLITTTLNITKTFI